MTDRVGHSKVPLEASIRGVVTRREAEVPLADLWIKKRSCDLSLYGVWVSPSMACWSWSLTMAVR